MKIVLTNDDGIDAPGLGALTKAVAGWGESVTVAPTFVQSGVGHQVTTKSPIVVVELEERTLVEEARLETMRLVA